MNGKQFIKAAKSWAKAHNVEIRVVSDRGKGGHQAVYLGDHFTIVKTGDIGAGLFHAMLHQLNIPKSEF